jgi:hypothetical protein
VKITRQYKLMSMPKGRIDQSILEIVTEEGQPERRSEFAGFLPGTHPETQFDMVEALNRAYRQGREDRAAEIPPEELPRVQHYDPRKSEPLARLNIRRALTETEKARILDQGVTANPLMRGARYDDILEHAWDTDAYVSATEPFFDANHGWTDFPGAAYAAMVICAQGRPLTPQAVADMMFRAGLGPAGDGADLSDRYHEGDMVEFPGDGINTPLTRQGMVMRVMTARQKNPLLLLGVADMPDGISLMRPAAAVWMLQPAPRA